MINFFTGTMKSGKSAYLIEKALGYATKNAKVLYIRPKSDTRDFITRKNIHFETNKIVFGNEDTSFSGFKVIFIDEIHLFDLDFIKRVIENKNDKRFFLAGLTHDLDEKMFDYVGILFKHISEIKIMTAKCDICHSKNAFYHQRIGQEIVGDNYRVLCEECQKIS